MVLRYYDDMTEAQIAEVLGCSSGAVKSHASRGLRRLQEQLGGPGYITTHTEESHHGTAT